ncbi:3263_t:CDS:2, partial [Acaulospora colombiana]
ERRVVYLPDCRELAVNPVNYIKSALFLTYVEDDAKISEINACENFDQIIKFCRSLDEGLYFIVDQMNALDDCDNTGINLEKKIQEEIEEWWKKYNSVLPTMNNQQKDQIEDITGNIPLFLNVLLESDCKNFEDALGYLNRQLKSKIQEPMTSFSENIYKLDNKSWDLHVKLMSSSLTKRNPPSGYGFNDFDHRFFYIENQLCHYVCGMARDCMAKYLYEKGKWKYLQI